jgi:hypothetical protein
LFEPVFTEFLFEFSDGGSSFLEHATNFGKIVGLGWGEKEPLSIPSRISSGIDFVINQVLTELRLGCSVSFPTLLRRRSGALIAARGGRRKISAAGRSAAMTGIGASMAASQTTARRTVCVRHMRRTPR